MGMTKTTAMSDTIPAPAASGTGSTTSLVEWTALPVLHAKAQPRQGEPGVEDQLDDKDARALRLHAKRIAELRDATNRTMTKAIIDIGGELSAARALLAGKGREGRFRPWCKRQGFSKSSVYRAIAAHAVFGMCPTLGHFFDPQAVYLLTAESCPAAARAEALQLADQGNRVGCDLAKQIVAKFVPKTTTGTKQLEHRPEAEKPADEVSATTSGTGAANAGDVAAAAADPPVSADDSATGIADAERQTGLAGLKAVIAALEDKGLYEEYRQVLDRIRVALEGNIGQEEESEEAGEWKF